MEGWKENKLKDFLLVPIRNGLTKPSAIRGNGVKMIGMKEIFSMDLIQSVEMDRVPVTEREYEYSSIQENDLLFARQSLTLEGAGKCAIVTCVEEPTVFESHLIRLRIDKSKANPFYIFYYFKSNIGRNKIRSLVQQVAAAGIRGKELVELSIITPPLDYQNQIVDILKSLDDKIECNRRINDNLEQQAQALFKSWFVDFEPFRDQPFVESELGMIPKGWRVGKLSDIADIYMGASPAGSSYNVLGIGDVFYQGRAEFGVRFPQRNMYTTEAKRFAEVNSVLLSVRAPVGDINVAEEKCCIGRGLASIKSKTNHNSFNLYLMKQLKPIFDTYNGEGTVFGCINKKALESIKIIIPCENTVSDFEDIVKGIDKKISNLDKQSRILAQTRDTLLPRLMSGELEVQEIEESL